MTYNLKNAVAAFDAATGFKFSRIELRPHDLPVLVQLCEIYGLEGLAQTICAAITPSNPEPRRGAANVAPKPNESTTAGPGKL